MGVRLKGIYYQTRIPTYNVQNEKRTQCVSNNIKSSACFAYIIPCKLIVVYFGLIKVCFKLLG